MHFSLMHTLKAIFVDFHNILAILVLLKRYPILKLYNLDFEHPGLSLQEHQTLISSEHAFTASSL